MSEQKGTARFSFDMRKYMMVIALIGIWVIFEAISTGTYLTPRNLSNLFRQSVFTAILAIGMLNVIVLGHIDLSVGSLAGLCGGILAIANVWKGLSRVRQSSLPSRSGSFWACGTVGGSPTEMCRPSLSQWPGCSSFEGCWSASRTG